MYSHLTLSRMGLEHVLTFDSEQDGSEHVLTFDCEQEWGIVACHSCYKTLKTEVRSAQIAPRDLTIS